MTTSGRDDNGVADVSSRRTPMSPLPSPLLAHPAFAPYAAALATYQAISAGHAAPPTDVPVFVPPPARSISAIDYERRVVEQNELIVRAENLHDVMNALVWLTFPKAKRAISAAHVALGVTADGKTRPRRRDVLTLFDEAGIIILCPRDDLKKLHEGHQWRALFVAHRQTFIDDARVILFGHGALEQLGCRPHRALTVKALWLPLAPASSSAEVDHWMATRVASGELLGAREHRLPLPILGVPGWFAENEHAECYEHTDIFRPLRGRVNP